MSIDFNDILEEDAAIEYALTRLGEYVNFLYPTHALVLDQSPDTILPIVPYVSCTILTGAGMNAGTGGNRPIFAQINDIGESRYVYQEFLNIQLKAHKTDAFKVMKRIKKMFTNPKVHTQFFDDPLVGVTNFGQVLNAPTPMDNQKWEEGASMTLTLSYLHKVEDLEDGRITEVKFNSSTVTGTGGVVVDNGLSDVVSP